MGLQELRVKGRNSDYSAEDLIVIGYTSDSQKLLKYHLVNRIEDLSSTIDCNNCAKRISKKLPLVPFWVAF